MNCKRFISVVLASSIAVSLAACGKPKESPVVSTANNTTKSNELVTYTLMAKVVPNSGDWSKMWIFNVIEKELNIKFDINQVSSESFEEKKKLAFATNNYPNLFFGGLNDTDIANYASQKIILPLESYINKENTPNIIEKFSKFPNVKKSITFPDGHIYNLTGFNDVARELAKDRFWINKRWAEDLKVKIPTNLDEFYTYLKAVKTSDPKKIPLGGIYNKYGDSSMPILAAFGFTENRIEAKDGKVIFVPAHPVYKEYLTYMNKLYKEKLLDPEYFTQTDEQRKAKQANGLVAAFNDAAHWLNIPKEEIWKQYGAIEPMTSKYNSTKMWPAYDLNSVGGFIMTNTTKDPQNLMRLVDWCYTDNGATSIISGPQKGRWEQNPDLGWEIQANSDGKKLMVHNFPQDKYATKNAWTQAVVSPGYGVFPTGPRTMYDTTLEKENSLTNEIIKNLVPYYHTGWSNNIRFIKEEASEISLIKTDIYTYVEQMESKMIIGDEPIDNLDKMIKGCKDRGLDRYLEINQKAYDRWVKIK